MPKLLCFFFGVLLLFTARAAYAVLPKPVVKHVQQALHADSSKIDVHSFNKDALQQYAKQRDFKYDEAPVQGLSWWDRFWRWIWHIISEIFRKISLGKTSWFLFRIALFTIAAGAIAFIIFKIMGIDVVKLFRGESQNIDIPYGESLENIHEINFDAEIENAVNNRNYRLAVRLLYLGALKQLSDAGLIHWKIDKTNTSYLNELDNTEYRQLFGLLTTQFEYVWYGDFPVNGQSFQNINALFIDFKKGLP